MKDPKKKAENKNHSPLGALKWEAQERHPSD